MGDSRRKLFETREELYTACHKVKKLICEKGRYKQDFIRFSPLSSSMKSLLTSALRSSGTIHEPYDKHTILQWRTFRNMIINHVCKELGIELKTKMPEINKIQQIVERDFTSINAKPEEDMTSAFKEVVTDFVFGHEHTDMSVGFASSRPLKENERVDPKSGMVFAYPDIPTNHEENPMQVLDSLKLTRPVLVGTTNILTAADDVLVVIIRECNTQIEKDYDMTEISSKFRTQEKELKTVIKLCLTQLDKEDSPT